jgi:Protein of unknown function with HXXEE motif
MTTSRIAQRHWPALSFRTALWLMPLAAIAHNLEEYPRIADYGARHLGGLMPSASQLAPAIVLADLLPIVVAANAWRAAPGSWRLQVALGLQAAFGANVLSHVGQTVFFQDYSPGTLTGVLLVAPVTLYLFNRAAREHVLTVKQLQASAALGILAMLPGILGLQALGQLLADSSS